MNYHPALGMDVRPVSLAQPSFDPKAVLAELEEHVETAIRAAEVENPVVAKFHQGLFASQSCFVRHLVEAVVRMRENDEVDLFCLSRVGFSDRSVAIPLLDYLAEEAKHGELLLGDLRCFGVDERAVKAEEPLFSTRLLIGYLLRAIHREGVLPNLVWAWFVEWYSARYNPTMFRKAAERFGAEKLRGTFRHLQIDAKDDHVGLMAELLARQVERDDALARAKTHASDFVRLVAMYYVELAETSVDWRPHE
jgi:hypothetical protein